MQIEIDIFKFEILPYEDDDFLGYIIEYGLKFDDHFKVAPISCHINSIQDAKYAAILWYKIGMPNEMVSISIQSETITTSPWDLSLLKSLSDKNVVFPKLESVYYTKEDCLYLPCKINMTRTYENGTMVSYNIYCTDKDADVILNSFQHALLLD